MRTGICVVSNLYVSCRRLARLALHGNRSREPAAQIAGKGGKTRMVMLDAADIPLVPPDLTQGAINLMG
jgi:hypothetical protein